MKLVRHLIGWLRQRLPSINLKLAGAAWLANLFLFQAFCQPVLWAGLVLLFSVGAFLAWPWLATASTRVRYGAVFLQGVAFTCCVYCAWFISLQSSAYLVSLVFCWLLVPMLAWVPAFFGLQILGRVIRFGRWGWLAFLAGVFALAPALWWAEQQYREVEAIVQRLPVAERAYSPALVRALPRTYMVERLAGAGFLYHTAPEFYFDGWRPPLHDPLLVICLNLFRPPQLYGKAFPFPLTLSSGVTWKVKLYQQLFPGRPVKLACLCNYGFDGSSYWRWQPGQD